MIETRPAAGKSIVFRVFPSSRASRGMRFLLQKGVRRYTRFPFMKGFFFAF
jgi:hypothetical protein